LFFVGFGWIILFYQRLPENEIGFVRYFLPREAMGISLL